MILPNPFPKEGDWEDSDDKNLLFPKIKSSCNIALRVPKKATGPRQHKEMMNLYVANKSEKKRPIIVVRT